MTSLGRTWSTCTAGEWRGNTAQSLGVTDPLPATWCHSTSASPGPKQTTKTSLKVLVLIACQKQHGLLLQNKRKDKTDIHQLVTSSILLWVELFVRTDYLPLSLEAQLKVQLGCSLVLQYLLPNVPSACARLETICQQISSPVDSSPCPKLTAQ